LEIAPLLEQGFEMGFGVYVGALAGHGVTPSYAALRIKSIPLYLRVAKTKKSATSDSAGAPPT
jgi:hypothetical protein